MTESSSNELADEISTMWSKAFNEALEKAAPDGKLAVDFGTLDGIMTALAEVGAQATLLFNKLAIVMLLSTEDDSPVGQFTSAGLDKFKQS